MKIKSLLLVLVVAGGMLASCAMMPLGASRSSEYSEEDRVESVMEMPAAPKMMEGAPAEAEYAEESGDYSSAGAGVERIVIKNANLSIVVEDPGKAMETITQMAEEMLGFVVTSNLYKTTTSSGLEVPNANITIRVPSEQLDAALEQIKALVNDPKVDILNEEVSGQDVTSEVTDLESRLRNLEAAETQLLEIMDDAIDSEDVITIFRELTSVREEIELIQGQIKYYRESARLSAISVYLQAKAAVEPITIGGWQPGVEVQRAIQALVEGGKFIVNALIWIVLFAIPILAVIVLPVFFIFKAIRKRQIRKKEAGKK